MGVFFVIVFLFVDVFYGRDAFPNLRRTLDIVVRGDSGKGVLLLPIMLRLSTTFGHPMSIQLGNRVLAPYAIRADPRRVIVRVVRIRVHAVLLRNRSVTLNGPGLRFHVCI